MEQLETLTAEINAKIRNSCNVIIMGAAGRDFHNYNLFFKNNENYRVVAFTAAEQIPGISNKYYADIPIYPEDDLPDLIKKHDIDQVILAYSDLSHETVMQKASLVLAAGADFKLMGPKTTMLQSTKYVISVCAVRTGCGKSQTTKHVAEILRLCGHKVVIIRHPMPYGDLPSQTCQRYSTLEDLETNNCTIEEREEYEHYIQAGFVIYAGIDYQKILREAEKEADVIIWDGGNNDTPFYKTNFHIVVTDPLRAGDELTYYPGLVNLRMADYVIINKCNSATEEQIERVQENIRTVNNRAKIVLADSEIIVDRPELIRGKILVVEDGPTLTHGNLESGAGFKAVSDSEYWYPDTEIINAREFAVGSIKEVYNKYPHLGYMLPAVGYNPKQIKDLEATINNSNADVVVSATPVDLSKIMKINKPVVNVIYKLSLDEKEHTFVNFILNIKIKK